MRTIYTFRFVPALISAAIAVFSFLRLSAASMPYQDPTVEMLEKQSQQIALAKNWLVFGGVLIVASIVFCIAVRRLHKHS